MATATATRAEIGVSVKDSWDALLPVDRIDVDVSRGWVTLRGEVDWHFQKEEAERVVRRLWGVRGVTNTLVENRITVAP